MKTLFSTMTETISDTVEVGDSVKAQDDKWYTITTVNHGTGMAAGRAEDDDEKVAIFWLIKIL